MAKAKVWKVYDTLKGEFVFSGRRKQVAEFIGSEGLYGGDRIQENRLYKRRYLMKLSYDPNEGLIRTKKFRPQKEPLPEWANDDRKYYEHIMEVYSVLKYTGNFGLATGAKGSDYIEPMRRLGLDVKVRDTQGRIIDGRGKKEYFDILEVV